MKDVTAVAALIFALTLVSSDTLAQGKLDLSLGERNEGWTVSKYSSPFAKGRAVVLSRLKTDAESFFDDAKLSIQCFKNETTVFMDWFVRVTNMQRPMVSFQVGDDPVEEARWTSSPAGWSLTYEGDSIELVKRFLAADKFSVEVTQKYTRQATAEWDLTGLSDEITPLREACGW